MFIPITCIIKLINYFYISESFIIGTIYTFNTLNPPVL